MQIEIKFRAWDEKNKIMHYDFQFIKSGNNDNDFIIFVSDKQKIEMGFDSWAKNPYFQQQFKIMEYIGEKDKNGKEIYENDIVKKERIVEEWKRLSKVSYGIVFFEDAEYKVKLIKKDKEDCFYSYEGREFCWSDLEVVANIYDNPELLEED